VFLLSLSLSLSGKTPLEKRNGYSDSLLEKQKPKTFLHPETNKTKVPVSRNTQPITEAKL
jgi:hypothetical protein